MRVSASTHNAISSLHTAKHNHIKLIDIRRMRGSLGTLKRPGLQAALAMLRRGTVNTLIVVKLDRLSVRCVMCALVEDYFGNEQLFTCCHCAEWRTPTAQRDG